MCSLGHEEDMPARAPQRKREGVNRSFIGPAQERRRQPARSILAQRRQALHADLQQSNAAAEYEQHEFNPEQMELLPPDMQQLPDHLVRERIHEPRPAWWTTAAERD